MQASDLLLIMRGAEPQQISRFHQSKTKVLSIDTITIDHLLVSPVITMPWGSYCNGDVDAICSIFPMSQRLAVESPPHSPLGAVLSPLSSPSSYNTLPPVIAPLGPSGQSWWRIYFQKLCNAMHIRENEMVVINVQPARERVEERARAHSVVKEMIILPNRRSRRVN